MSQAVFASVLDITAGYLSELERGAWRPTALTMFTSSAAKVSTLFFKSGFPPRIRSSVPRAKRFMRCIESLYGSLAGPSIIRYLGP